MTMIFGSVIRHHVATSRLRLLLQATTSGRIERSMSISRMLDLGGAPSALNAKQSNTSLNLNKNCHLQAVMFDFDVLTRSIEASKPTTAVDRGGVKSSSAPSVTVQPDKSKIEQVANMLGVDLTGKKDKQIANEPFGDDLSLLTGEKFVNQKQEKVRRTKEPASITKKSANPLDTDIRSKYAAKLKSHGLSVASVDQAKHEVEEHEQRGDAAGHMAARKLASTDTSSSKKRWMAATGTGKLLLYLHQRSMKIAIVAAPVPHKLPQLNDVIREEAHNMDEFVKQMMDHTSFDVVLKQDGSYTVEKLVQTTIAKLLKGAIAPGRCLWVSDRDDCLLCAKEAGLITVRIRPMNARRGNVSSHYTVPSVPETQNVINEINGISFNTVLQQ